jgi:enoyl-CoA hydratase/carnithine racemase
MADTPPGGPVALARHDGGILTIGINRPEAQNRLDPATLIALGKAYYTLEHDAALRVGVLHGHGPDFCPGIDPEPFAAAVRAGTFPPRDPELINPFGLRGPTRTKPLVAAVHGATALGGHELFLAADVRVAASDTRFGQGEVTRGVFPGGGATVRFVREAGWGNAMRYMLTGEAWGAEEARRMGPVAVVTPPGRQLDTALALARRIAAAAPLGVQATIASARQALPAEVEALAAITPVFQRLLQSEDRDEYFRAEREGRAPVFRGR